jgi:hypothetical protein
MSDVTQDEAARRQWVSAVLGYTIGSPGGAAVQTASGANPDWQAARLAWDAASETADKQIAALQQALKASGDEELEAIAEFGPNGVTGNHWVRLMAALMEIGDGAPEAMARAGAKALKIARSADASRNR